MMTRKTASRKSRAIRTLREIGELEDRYQVTATVSRAEEQRLRDRYPLSNLTRLRVKTETRVSLSRQIAESEMTLRAHPNQQTAFKLQRELIELNRILLQIEDSALGLCQSLAQTASLAVEEHAEKVPA
jgi:hypothetical protein